MTETSRLHDLESKRPKQPYELRRGVLALRKLRKAEEGAKSGQCQAESDNNAVVQELNPSEADETHVKDEPATQSHENNGSKSAYDSKDTSIDIGSLTKALSEATLKTPVIKKTPEGIWNELTNNTDPKLARYRSLDITLYSSWFESTLRKVNIILEKTADRRQSKGGDEDSAIERRNDVLKMFMQVALELGSYILDSPELARKLPAQHDVQNEDPRNAVTLLGTGTDPPTDENTILAVTQCENCSGALAPYQGIEVLEEPTQDPRDMLRFFDYIQEDSPSLYYTIDLYEQIYSLRLEKHHEGSKEKTVARLYIPKTTPTSNVPKTQIINSISGWDGTLPETRYPSTFISNQTWTGSVQTLCRIIGYPLKPSRKDESGNPGTYNACHAEKQIIAYWLYNYVLSSRSTDPWKRWDKIQNEPIRPEYYEGLHIDVSKYSCDCCLRPELQRDD